MTLSQPSSLPVGYASSSAQASIAPFWRRIARMILCVPALLVIVVPFTSDISPALVILEFIRHAEELFPSNWSSSSASLLLLAVPFLLAIPLTLLRIAELRRSGARPIVRIVLWTIA